RTRPAPCAKLSCNGRRPWACWTSLAAMRCAGRTAIRSGCAIASIRSSACRRCGANSACCEFGACRMSSMQGSANSPAGRYTRDMKRRIPVHILILDDQVLDAEELKINLERPELWGASGPYRPVILQAFNPTDALEILLRQP